MIRAKRDLKRLAVRRGLLSAWRVVVVVALAGGLVLASSLGCNSSGSAPSLNVLPFPGTPDASPQSQISFPASAPSDLKTVTVEGSRSGQHSGSLSALPDGRGTAFVPEHPFAPGERVSVREPRPRPLPPRWVRRATRDHFCVHDRCLPPPPRLQPQSSCHEASPPSPAT